MKLDGMGLDCKHTMWLLDFKINLKQKYLIRTMDKLRHKEMKKSIPFNYRRSKYKRRRQLELCKHL